MPVSRLLAAGAAAGLTAWLAVSCGAPAPAAQPAVPTQQQEQAQPMVQTQQQPAPLSAPPQAQRAAPIASPQVAPQGLSCDSPVPSRPAKLVPCAGAP